MRGAMDKIRSLAIFVRVAETGSFSRCAEVLRLGQPTVSKAINSLERELGAKLFNRNTRSIILTEEGKCILQEARKVVGSYDELVQSAGLKSAAQGVVRVTCPVAFGSLYLIPKLNRFHRNFPNIKVHLQMTDRFLDLVENDVDVAFRIGKVEVGNYVAQHIGDVERIAVAHQAYLSENPAPNAAEDLKQHSCILVGKNDATSWWSGRRKNGQSFSIEVQGPYSVDSFLGLKYAVESALGIGLAVKFIFESDGRLPRHLVRILPQLQFQSLPLHILFAQSRHQPARLRTVIDFFGADLKEQSWIRTHG
jgi:DNA-binding transcriptional LysR family regulator